MQTSNAESIYNGEIVAGSLLVNESRKIAGILIQKVDSLLSKKDIALKIGKSRPTRYLNDLMQSLLKKDAVEYTLPASHTFHADRSSIILNELNLESLSFHPFLKKRRDFFKSQDRLNRLKKWTAPKDTEDDLNLKMIAVITKFDQPHPFRF